MSARLDLLRPTLDAYRRPFHALDLGGGIEPSQNIGQEIAREYPHAHVTVVEKDWTREKFVPSPRTMVVRRHMGVDDLRVLSTCEHFDVVLMLNVLHWYESEWEDVLKCVTSMADWIAVQIPEMYEDDEMVPGRQYIGNMYEWIGGYIRKSGSMLLDETVQFPNHRPRPLWLLKGNSFGGRRLTRTHVDAEIGWADTLVNSSTHALWAYMKKKQKWVSPWRPGLNLYNFVHWGGVWPDAGEICRQLDAVPLARGRRTDGHGDVTMHNFVMDGERMWLVDGGEGWESDDAEELERVKREVRMKMEASKCLG